MWEAQTRPPYRRNSDSRFADPQSQKSAAVKNITAVNERGIHVSSSIDDVGKFMARVLRQPRGVNPVADISHGFLNDALSASKGKDG